MPEARRDPVHDQRIQLLQLGSDHQRRGLRGYREGERQRDKNGMAEHESELGPELAIQRGVGGPGPLFPGHGQGQADLHLLEHCTPELAFWSNLHWQELQGLKFQF